ncbi:unnamed protein product, partial [Symbiodinium necroappetens]
TPASFEIADANASVSNITFPDEDLDLHEVGGTVSWNPPDLYEEAVAHYRVYIAMNDRGLDRILAAPQSPVGTNFGDVPAETILPYCDQSANVRPIALQAAQPTVVLVHSVSTLSEQTTPTWKNVSDTNFQVTNVQLEDLDLDFQQLGGSITWDIPYQESLVTHYMVYFGRLIYSYGTDTDGDWFINTASKDT